jgi:hypothetical protein
VRIEESASRCLDFPTLGFGHGSKISPKGPSSEGCPWFLGAEAQASCGPVGACYKYIWNKSSRILSVTLAGASRSSAWPGFAVPRSCRARLDKDHGLCACGHRRGFLVLSPASQCAGRFGAIPVHQIGLSSIMASDARLNQSDLHRDRGLQMGLVRDKGLVSKSSKRPGDAS